jgi:hypothetical protein
VLATPDRPVLAAVNRAILKLGDTPDRDVDPDHRIRPAV